MQNTALGIFSEESHMIEFDLYILSDIVVHVRRILIIG